MPSRLVCQQLAPNRGPPVNNATHIQNYKLQSEREMREFTRSPEPMPADAKTLEVNTNESGTDMYAVIHQVYSDPSRDYLSHSIIII